LASTEKIKLKPGEKIITIL